MAAFSVLVTGASGFLGPWLAAALRQAGHTVFGVARTAGDVLVDLDSPTQVHALLRALRPDLVLNLVALSRLGDCKADPARARRVNAWLPGALAERLGSRLLHVSTDLVFDGGGAPYGPLAAQAPLSVYGATKAEGEEQVLRHGGRVVRLPLLFGPDGQGRGASGMIRQALAAERPVALFTNEYRTPLHVADAAAGLTALLPDCDGPRISHLPGPERLSRWQFAQRLCALHRLPTALLRAVECQDPDRPRDVSLSGGMPPSRSLAAMLADA
ncbi:MAG: SDR family oxidoreductase [Planctomycetes bacterium]|nr:SDR family oxidoreductase [Planctomycetota bacterium]